jgi:hypothetical protein
MSDEVLARVASESQAERRRIQEAARAE